MEPTPQTTWIHCDGLGITSYLTYITVEILCYSLIILLPTAVQQNGITSEDNSSIIVVPGTGPGPNTGTPVTACLLGTVGLIHMHT